MGIKQNIIFLVTLVAGLVPASVFGVYQDDIDALNPTHYWTFDNTLNDRGNGILTNGSFEGSASYGAAITADSTNSLQANTGQATVENTTDMNIGPNLYQTRSIATWFEVSDLENPTVIWEEGGNINNFAITAGVARNVSVQATDDGEYYLSRFADNLIETGKPYHIVFTWERGTTTGGAGTRLRMWLNGVEQGTSYDVTSPSTAEFPDHIGDINFGNTTDSLRFYNNVTLDYVQNNKQLAHFAIWNDQLLSQSDIDILFENGATSISQNLSLFSVGADTSISLHEITSLGGDLVSLMSSEVRNSGGDVVIPYNVTTEIPARLRLVKYGSSTYETDFTLDRFPSTTPLFTLPDDLITESDPAIVRAYTTIDNLDELYDRSRAYDEDTPANGFDLVSVSGTALDLGDYDLVIDSTAGSAFDVDTGSETITINTSSFTAGSNFDSLQTTGTVSFQNGASSSGILITDSTGTNSVLTLSGIPAGSTVYLEDDSDVQQDYQTGVSGTYQFNVPPSATGTWTYVVKQEGYTAQVGSFDPTGAFYDFNVNISQRVQPNGTVMFTGTSSALVDVSFTGTTQVNIDIGDGIVSGQDVLDEFESALTTADGMAWYAAGKSDASLAILSAGTFFFATDDIRFRRRASGDVNATVNAFSISTQGIVTDGVNGSVTFLSASQADDIAAAVWNKVLSDHVTTDTFGKLVQDIAGPGFDPAEDSLSVQIDTMFSRGIVGVNTLKDLIE